MLMKVAINLDLITSEAMAAWQVGIAAMALPQRSVVKGRRRGGRFSKVTKVMPK